MNGYMKQMCSLLSISDGALVYFRGHSVKVNRDLSTGIEKRAWKINDQKTSEDKVKEFFLKNGVC